MYNKKAADSNKSRETKNKGNKKEIKEENKEKTINKEENKNENKYKIEEKNIIKEEDTDKEHKNHFEIKEKLNKIKNNLNQESFQNIRKRFNSLIKSDEQTIKIVSSYESKIKELELIINQKEEEINKLKDNMNNSEEIKKPLWNEVIKEEKKNNICINGINYSEQEIISILNKIRKPFNINKENEIELINNIEKTQPELIIENIINIKIQENLNAQNLYQQNGSSKNNYSYQIINGQNFLIKGNKNKEYFIEERDTIQLSEIKKKLLYEVILSDKFTIEQNKSITFVNLIEENINSMQILSSEKEKKIEKKQLEIENSYKFNIQSITKPILEKENKDNAASSSNKEPLQYINTVKFYIQGIKREEINKVKNASEELLKNNKDLLQSIHTNEFLIKQNNKAINEIQLTHQFEIQKIVKPDNKYKWITEMDKNNKFIIEGIEKPLNKIISNNKIELLGKMKKGNKYEDKTEVRNKQKNDNITNTEENNIKMTINYKDNPVYNYEKVIMDEKHPDNKACDGCFIY